MESDFRDRISEVTNSIKERLSNPFIFSFIISWIFYNWKIAVGLLFFDSAQLTKEGYSSIFDLIAKEIQKDESFVCPLLISILLTMAAPIVKTTFSLFNAKVITLGNSFFFRITKKASVAAEKYYEYKIKYENAFIELSKAIDSENQYRKLYEDSQQSLKKAEETNKILPVMLDSTFLNGKWELTRVKGGSIEVFNFFGTSFTITRNTELVWNSGQILFFFRDVRDGLLFFQIYQAERPGELRSYRLSTYDNSSFEGSENNSERVILRRVMIDKGSQDQEVKQ